MAAPCSGRHGWKHPVLPGRALAGTTVGYQITLNVTSIAGDTFNQYFAERVDEIAIWSRSLSSTEIANIFSLQSGVYATTEDFTFTPDIAGTYDVNLTAIGRDGGEVQVDTDTGTLVVSASPPPSSGDNSINFAGYLASSDRALLSSSIIKRIVRRKK